LTQHTLGLVGSEVARHLDPAEKPGLFTPANLEHDGKDRLGAVLALEDRAIIAWTTGTLRIKNFETVIPRSSVERTETGTRPAGAMSKDRETLSIVTESDTWDLVFPNVFEGGRSIVPFVVAMLEGALELKFGE
jgi:hypothetical protein